MNIHCFISTLHFCQLSITVIIKVSFIKKSLQSVVNEGFTVDTTEISFLTRNYVRQARGHHRSLCSSLCRLHYGKASSDSLHRVLQSGLLQILIRKKCSCELLCIFYEWDWHSDEYCNFQYTSHVIGNCFCIRKLCLLRHDEAHV